MLPALNLGDPALFRRGYDHVRASDARLGKVLERQGVISFRPQGEPFESVVESILSQQVAGAAADAIIRRVRSIYPDGRLIPASVAATHPSKLRRAGVSPQKMRYLKDLSARVVDGRLDLEEVAKKSDEEIIEQLDEVRGVGPWTAHMFLIFTLGRPDVLPVDDLGIRKGVQQIYRMRNLPSKDEITAVAERWHPFCTVASLYLWRAKDAGQLTAAKA